MTTPPDITGLVISFNEAANITRCLERLRWIPRVVVLDSFSTDETVELARAFPNVEVVQRGFDTFAGQCNHGLSLIESTWVLSLDCDYVLREGFEQEVAALITANNHSGWMAHFSYCIHGRPLSATLYPARCVLYRKEVAHYEDEGHGHRVRVAGRIGEIVTRIDHDDRKPLTRWFASQIKYAEGESEFLIDAAEHELNRMDRLRRRAWLAPILVPAYCLLVKGLWRDGWGGWAYTLQRWTAECMIALAMLERRLKRNHPHS